MVSAGLRAQTPAPEEFYPAKLLVISVGPPYSYKFDIGGEGYVGTSDSHLRLTEGSQVKIKVSSGTIYVVDEDGRVQRMKLALQYLGPPPPPPQKK